MKIVFVVILALLSAGGVGLVLNGSNQLKKDPAVSAKPAASVIAQPDIQEAEDSEASEKPMKERVSEALNKKDYDRLGLLLEDKVEITLYKMNCCGTLPRSLVLGQTSYIKNAKLPWNFDEKNTIVPKILSADKKTFEGLTFGTSADKMAIGFHTNDSNKIDKLVVVANYQEFIK
jgi:hypothetical protein